MKRFYKEVTTAPTDRDGKDGFQILLDGRALKTQARGAQILPTIALAEAMADEWRAQGEKIDTKSFILRDLADYAIDQIAPDPQTVIAELLAFAQTDTLCYFAEPDEALFERQQKVWEPLLIAFEAEHSIRLERISGIIHSAQSKASMDRFRQILQDQSAFALAAIQTTASIAASLVIGLEAVSDKQDTDESTGALFNAANLEEDWQIELWGEDELAAETRENHAKSFTMAAQFARLARG